jgi:hypothetical protein
MTTFLNLMVVLIPFLLISAVFSRITIVELSLPSAKAPAPPFSTKGEPFEGDKERFSAHRSDCLLALDDFHRLVIEEGTRKRVVAPLFRDHGHDANMRESYAMVRPKGNESPGADVSYVWETGMVMLKTKQALDQGQVMTVERGYDPSCLEER